MKLQAQKWSCRPGNGILADPVLSPILPVNYLQPYQGKKLKYERREEEEGDRRKASIKIGMR
jgi:hypothetical protein